MLIISPFMLTVYAGVALAYRSQYTLPFVIAVGFVYLTRRRDDETVEKKKSINKIVRKTIQAGVLISCNCSRIESDIYNIEILVCG